MHSIIVFKEPTLFFIYFSGKFTDSSTDLNAINEL